MKRFKLGYEEVKQAVNVIRNRGVCTLNIDGLAKCPSNRM
jgi:hypothetical protein